MKSKLTLMFSLVCLVFIQINSFAQCNFTISDSSPCFTEEVRFEVVNPATTASYAWDIDEDGNTDFEGSSFTYDFANFPADSTILVTLYEDGDSCSTQSLVLNTVPDVSIGVTPGLIVVDGDEMRACNGSPTIDLVLFNRSETYDDNIKYTIDWGDGSAADEYNNTTFSNTQTISHTYMRLGYFTIFVTVEHRNGCVFTKNYTFYNGGNPSVGLVNPGNTVGLCAPATLDFPITNTENNPPGTEYMIYVNGEVVDTFTQENVPDVFTYTFTENSCGANTTTGSYTNAFDLRILASNPCNSSAATIEPIEVTTPPTPDFDIASPISICAGEEYTFTDLSRDIIEIISGNPSSCIDVLSPNWSISGTANEDWVLNNGSLFGSEQIGVEFLKPGVYTIELTIVSFSCGPLSISRDITIYEPPEIIPTDSIPFLGQDGSQALCAPLQAIMPKIAKGDSLSYNWIISPDTGWEFLDSTNSASLQPKIQFNEGGVYDVRVEVTNPCSVVSWQASLEVPGPPAAIMDPIPDFCQTATLNFDSANIDIRANGSLINEISWRFPGADLESTDELYPKNINYANPGVYPVELLLKNACGEQIITDTFRVQEPTSLNLPPDTTVCINEGPLTLIATPEGGTWSGTGIQEDVFNPAIARSGNHSITYSFGVGACFVEDQFTISVLDAPSIDAGPDQSLCENDATIALTGSPAGGLWTTEDSIDISALEIIPSKTPPGIYTLSYAFAGGQGCQGRDQLVVEIKPTPILEVPDTTYCNTPGRVTLPQANLVGGNWSGIGVVNATGQFDPGTAGGPGTYRLQYTYQAVNGCSAAYEIKVGVIDPTNVDAGPDQSLCFGDEVYVLSDFANPAGGRWTANTDGLVGDAFDPGEAGGGDYLFRYRVGTGNCRVEDTLRIKVIELNTVEAGPDQNICFDGNPLQLHGNVPATGTWEGPGIVNATTGIFDAQTVGVGSYTISFSIFDAETGCSNLDRKNVTVHPAPVADFELPSRICTNSSVQLRTAAEEISFIDWQISDGRTFSTLEPELSFATPGTYQISVNLENRFGCSNRTENSIQVIEAPKAKFTLPEREACKSLAVIPVNEGEGFEVSFYWDFGNGQVATESQPSIPIDYSVELEDRVFHLQLEAVNECGRDLYRDSVLVKATPLVDFGFTVDTACAPVNVAFNNVSAENVDNYYWDFGNGSTSTDSLPAMQSYYNDTIPVDYPIFLVGSNECGNDTITRVLTVEPETVEAFFNISKVEGCSPMTITLEDFSTPGTNISWDFGDGATSAVHDPIHTFTEAGRYLIRHYASNACAMDSSNIEIEVLPGPAVDFEFSTNLCVAQPVQFTNRSQNHTSSIWYFGNGDTSIVSDPTYEFNQTGTFDVRLRVTDIQSGCVAEAVEEVTILSAPEPAFDLNIAEGCTPLTIASINQSRQADFYEWDFGDGNSSVAISPEHTYFETGRYDVKLTVMDKHGCKADTVWTNVHAFPVPKAAFKVDRPVYCGLPATITVQNNTEGADGFLWNFADGGTSPLVSPQHEYRESGDYEIELNVSNQYGCKDATTQNLRLIDQPIADFGLDELSGCSPFTAVFQNYSDGETFLWDFGDAKTSTERLPTHQYVEAGRYDVQLIVGRENLCFDTLLLNGAVDVWQTPTASFEWADQIDGEPKGKILFNNTSKNALSYIWDFGDGTQSYEVHPTHRYYVNGIREVYLQALGEQGCTADTLVIIEPTFFGQLYIPNAFAPDLGKGEAQIFLPKGHGLKEFHLQIFSTYGELLWETFDLVEGQPSTGWDGTHKGYPLPQDVYVWKARAVFEDGTTWKGNKAISGKYQKAGSVTLLR